MKLMMVIEGVRDRDKICSLIEEFQKRSLDEIMELDWVQEVFSPALRTSSPVHRHHPPARPLLRQEQFSLMSAAMIWKATTSSFPIIFSRRPPTAWE